MRPGRSRHANVRSEHRNSDIPTRLVGGSGSVRLLRIAQQDQLDSEVDPLFNQALQFGVGRGRLSERHYSFEGLVLAFDRSKRGLCSFGTSLVFAIGLSRSSQRVADLRLAAPPLTFSSAVSDLVASGFSIRRSTLSSLGRRR